MHLFAPLTATGGDATGASSWGGGVGAFGMFFFQSAAIALKGGSGTGATSAGGPCTLFRLGAASVKSTAPISSAGGNGDGAPGGTGGSVKIHGYEVASSLAGVSAPGGTGTPNGNPGTVVIDGLQVP